MNKPFAYKDAEDHWRRTWEGLVVGAVDCLTPEQIQALHASLGKVIQQPDRFHIAFIDGMPRPVEGDDRD